MLVSNKFKGVSLFFRKPIRSYYLMISVITDHKMRKIFLLAEIKFNSPCIFLLFSNSILLQIQNFPHLSMRYIAIHIYGFHFNL